MRTCYVCSGRRSKIISQVEHPTLVVEFKDFSSDLAFAGSRAAAMFELRQKEWMRKLIEEASARHGEL